ncbi:CRISPR-associated endonuclease Cas9 [Rubritalea halochordaticola]|uniref:CRISPR-associated endonuclease Cas9 n=1 Tax=Rubritalea halochordaticola TaxID=714537 RepID=A0ABP9V2U9_9BACT
MSSCIHEKCVLVLNRQWQAISIISPAEAFGHMCTENADALKIEGNESMAPVSLSEWLKLEVRPHDRPVGTARGAIRAPTVIILREFAQVPLYKPKFSLKNLWVRDKGRCQYTGKLLKPSEASIDHVIPRSRGGATSWENCVLSEKALNSKKGARTPAEAGLKLIRPPYEPRPVPVTITLKNLLGIKDWDYFLVNRAA